MLYPVNEIFYSIQGEGMFTGWPAVFVRFSRCNMRCPFCDTDHSLQAVLTESDIQMAINDKIKEVKDKFESGEVEIEEWDPLIILTGGEPTIHDLEPLVDVLKRIGYEDIHIETNGSFLHRIPVGVSHVVISPKTYVNRIRFDKKISHEIKLVFQDPDRLVSELKQYEEWFPQAQRYSLQPRWDKDGNNNSLQVVQIVKEYPKWKLSLQTQKLINIS